MNRLGKILTLGLAKKRAWQLPLTNTNEQMTLDPF